MFRKNITFFCSAFSAVHAIANEPEEINSTNVFKLPQVTVIASEVKPSNVGKSTLDSKEIDRRQATTVQELLDELPGTNLTGSPRVGGQTINIWGFEDAEDVQIRLDGAPKLFQKYQQGSLFIEPELLKTVEVNKGPHSSLYGNGGFGGVTNMETKDADDLLREGQTTGAMIKSGFGTNNNMELYSASVYSGGKDNPFDVVVNFNKRRSGDMEDAKGNKFNYSGMDAKSGLIKLGYDISLSYIKNEDESLVPWAARTGLFNPSGDPKKKIVWRETEDETYLFKHRFMSDSWLNTDLILSVAKTDQEDKRPEEASKYSGSNMGNKSTTKYKTYFGEFKNTQEVKENANYPSHFITSCFERIKPA